MLENPKPSRIWDEPEVQDLADMPGVESVLCDGGAFGATDKDGFPIIKTYRIMVNSPILAQALNRRLSREERQACKPLEGTNVTNSQIYPADDMVRVILKAVKAEAKKQSPHRFEPHQVCFAQPVEDEQTWRHILDGVVNTFANSAVRSLTLQPGQEVYEMVCQLVPWQITRVQRFGLIRRGQPERVQQLAELGMH